MSAKAPLPEALSSFAFGDEGPSSRKRPFAALLPTSDGPRWHLAFHYTHLLQVTRPDPRPDQPPSPGQWLSSHQPVSPGGSPGASDSL